MFQFKKISIKSKYLLLFWAVFVFVLIAWPMPEHNGNVITFYDKIVHAFLFGIFYFLLFIFLKEKNKFKNSQIYLFSFFSATVYSALGEFIQIYIPGRTASEYDFFAGLVGIFIFLIITYVQFGKYKAPRG